MSSESKSQDALLNEVKGMMFEFLVASEFSKKFNIEKEFLSSIPLVDITTLNNAQKFLKKNAPDLYNSFNGLAKKTCDYYCLELNDKITSINLTGRSKQSKTVVADIVLVGDSIHEISLKLNKSGSAINTKSAGLKSWINEYFPVSNCAEMQNEFNKRLEQAFFQYCVEIHQFYNLEADVNFHYWREKKLPELPGDLPAEANLILKNFYHNLARLIFQDILVLKNNKEIFSIGIKKLLGFSSPNIEQLVCFADTSSGVSRFDKILKIDQKMLDLNSLECEFEDGQSYIKIITNEFTQLLRVKPMNNFTTMTYKLNSSVSYQF
jgi:hypothetical protein